MAKIDYLRQIGVSYTQWPLEDRVNPDAPQEEILAAYDAELDVLKKQGGYATADVINVTPGTPNLDAMLNRFNKEHTHSEDEVRFILKGRGVFHFHPDGHEVFALEVEPGDLINVPAGTKHWFDLCRTHHPRHPPVQRHQRLDPRIRRWFQAARATPAAVLGPELCGHRTPAQGSISHLDCCTFSRCETSNNQGA
jgi:cupin superfamily acireductone dioxygenase involved in methionine salvage